MSLALLPFDIWRLVISYLPETPDGEIYYRNCPDFQVLLPPSVCSHPANIKRSFAIKDVQALLLVSKQCYAMTMSCVWRKLCVAAVTGYAPGKSVCPRTMFDSPDSGSVLMKSSPYIWPNCLSNVVHLIADSRVLYLINYDKEDERVTEINALKLAQPKYLPALKKLDAMVLKDTEADIEDSFCATATYTTLSINLRIHVKNLYKLHQSRAQAVLRFVTSLELISLSKASKCIEPVQCMSALEELILGGPSPCDEFLETVINGRIELKGLKLEQMSKIRLPFTALIGPRVEEYTCGTLVFQSLVEAEQQYPQVKRFGLVMNPPTFSYTSQNMPFTGLEEFVCENRSGINHHLALNLVIGVLQANPNLRSLTMSHIQPDTVDLATNPLRFPQVRHARGLYCPKRYSGLSVANFFLEIFPRCRTLEVQGSYLPCIDYELLTRTIISNPHLKYIIIKCKVSMVNGKTLPGAFFSNFKDLCSFSSLEFCFPLVPTSDLSGAKGYVNKMSRKVLKACKTTKGSYIIDVDRLKKLLSIPIVTPEEVIAEEAGSIATFSDEESFFEEDTSGESRYESVNSMLDQLGLDSSDELDELDDIYDSDNGDSALPVDVEGPGY